MASETQCGPEEQIVAADDAIIGRAFRWSMVAIGLIAVGTGATLWVVNRPEPVAPTTQAVVVPAHRQEAAATAPVVHFTDVTAASGVDFTHENGATGDKLLPETMGAGAAFLDFDGDGDQDLLFNNGSHWPGHRPEDEPPATPALYRNSGAGTFENVTAGSGLDVNLYGMGIAVGDYDNDGRVDVFLAALGKNRLFRNLGGGKFEDMTAKAGVAGDATEWSTSSSFLDYDNDADLDLFVCNYVRWSKEIDFEVDYRLVGVGRAYGPPMNFQGTFPYLYRNNGDGTFSDVTAAAGMHIKNPATGVPIAKTLGVAPVDVDRDGWIDIYVANDTVQNFLFMNKGDGTFVERGAEFGLAYDRNGSATGAMGVDAGLYRNDDSLGFFIGNFANEMTSLYVSQGVENLFADEAIGEGIGGPTRLMLSFGLFLFDYDLDGRLDLLQANGHLEEEINIVQPSQHYEQPAQLFWNCGIRTRGCFVAVQPDRTGDLAAPLVGRGATYGDIDGDGDLDVVMTQAGRRAVVLRNEQQLGHHTVRVQLVGAEANRNAIGTWIEAVIGDTTLRRCVMPTKSYLCQAELPLTLGLGTSDRVDELRVLWPGGSLELIENVAADATYTIRQGEGVIRREPFSPAVKTAHAIVAP